MRLVERCFFVMFRSYRESAPCFCAYWRGTIRPCGWQACFEAGICNADTIGDGGGGLDGVLSSNAGAGSPYTRLKFGYSPGLIWIFRCVPFRRVLIYRSPLHGSLGFAGFHLILKLDLILVYPSVSSFLVLSYSSKSSSQLPYTADESFCLFV
jgi:hypothetical protein